MGKTTLSAFMSACPGIDTVKVKGRGKKNIDLFIAWATESFPRLKKIYPVETEEDIVCDSDVVAYCSSGATGDPSTYPIVKREWIRPGTFFAMPALGNFDDGVAGPDVRKILDNTGLYEAWMSELSPPAHNINPLVGLKFMDLVEEGKLNKHELEDLGKIVAGDAPGRTNDEEIIMLSVGGMPVEDVAWATVVYRNAIERGIGVSLNLWNEPMMS
jgi:ornithine cyclodeaminase